MTSYRVEFRERDEMWVVYSGGTPIRKFAKRKAATEAAAEFAGDGDRLTVFNKDGSVSRTHENPRD